MRSYTSAELAHLQSRGGVRARLLVWIVAKDRTTGALTPAGFWNGDDTQTFTIAGVPRTYAGAGGLLGMDELVLETGLNVRRQSVWLASAAQEVLDAIVGYDVRLAPVEIHRVLTDPVSHLPIDTPHRIWKGWVDGAPWVTPAKGLSAGRIGIAVASAAMALTRPLTGRFSDEAMRRRGTDDRLFRYADISGKVPVFWGERKYVHTPEAGPSRPSRFATGSLGPRGGDR